ALDVIEYEEMSFVNLDLNDLPTPFQYLRQSDQVILAPHIAGWSMESKKRHAEVLVEKINHFLMHQ
ncbi:MAG: hydroxyacid dehydrogenase, partial [Bacteroidota bacterium]